MTPFSALPQTPAIMLYDAAHHVNAVQGRCTTSKDAVQRGCAKMLYKDALQDDVTRMLLPYVQQPTCATTMSCFLPPIKLVLPQ
jgi:hypothetical protein